MRGLTPSWSPLNESSSRFSGSVSGPAVESGAAGARRLLSADAVRSASQRMLHLALSGDLADWTVDLDRLSPTADVVTEVIRQRYPTLDIPVHSRWRHLVFNGRDLWRDIAAGARWATPASAARAAFDLVITSVLLDAGAGPGWQFLDRATGLRVGRSEGLALASFRWFDSGCLSDVAGEPFRVDAAALRRVDGNAIQTAFQASSDNPLLGLEGRAALLNRLGAVMESRPDLFAVADSPRPGGLFDTLSARAVDGRLAATMILETLLEALGPIWDSRPTLDGVPLGDCWPHPALSGEHPEDGYVPLHKLSQWLAYSLIEPLEWAGVAVYGMEKLTGLAEYRNGGLFVDMGVIRARENTALVRTYPVSDPFVVGWRSLTVTLLDRLVPLIADRLGLTADQLPLARVLEGGTWAAGRLLAQRARTHGGPPFNVVSDGTVF